MSNNQMVSVPFQREDRYIVIKRSDLKKVPVNYRSHLVEPMLSLLAHLPRRECLVIESDWPEFEPAWAAIEARVTGKTAEQHQAEAINLAAVATLVDDGDGGLEASWLLEGGTAELFAGMTLLVADNAPDLCAEDGSAQVYTHADPAEVDRLRDENRRLHEAGEFLDGVNQGIEDKLRAQLAEAHALLREVGESGFMVDGQIMPSNEALELQDRVDLALSASA